MSGYLKLCCTSPASCTKSVSFQEGARCVLCAPLSLQPRSPGHIWAWKRCISVSGCVFITPHPPDPCSLILPWRARTEQQYLCHGGGCTKAVSHCIKLISASTESQDGLCWKGPDISSSNPLPGQGCRSQICSGLLQPGLEHFH